MVVVEGSFGFELGPIRPPSEAASLLVRVCRNCPWNKCAFCPVYKGRRFSRRPVGEVLADLETMAAVAEELQARSWRAGFGGRIDRQVLGALAASGELADLPEEALHVGLWLARGGRTVFLQDADALIEGRDFLVAVLRRLRELFPQVERVTAYSRSRTLARWSVEDLAAVREAGLDRVHVGLESGSDEVLSLVRKGCTSRHHVEGGRKALEAGLELSEYVMPGLGGRRLSRTHALETARVLTEIQPHFVRLRTLAVVPGTPLAQLVAEGRFEPMGDEEVVSELRLLLEHLKECHTRLVSDHILNLFEELEGRLPEDLPRLLGLLERYEQMPERDRVRYRVARRLGLVRSLAEAGDPAVRLQVDALLERAGVESQEDVEQLLAKLASQWV